MPIALEPIPRDELAVLASSGVPPRLVGRVTEGALPPWFVAHRALTALDGGAPARWSSTFYVVRLADGCVVGGCGFKGAPSSRRVEIGYAISSAAMGKGFATAAVRALLRAARESGEVDVVVAHVSPDNVASVRVVEKAGFVAGTPMTDDDGDVVVPWQVQVGA